jgi:citrate lyase gamma subunit
MKSLRSLLVAAAIIGITGCANGQMRNVVSKDRKMESFSGIRVSTGIDVYLKQGDEESLTVEADENLQEYILTEVRDDILHVYTEANIRDAEMKRVHVTMKKVYSIKTTSAGDVIGETPVSTDRLELSTSSAGNIRLEVNAREIELDISSAGDMTLSGNADELKADLSSAGDLNAYDLNVKEADISVSSAGNADVNVSERITARASSAGDINYRGDPKYIDAHSSSAGGIHRR